MRIKKHNRFNDRDITFYILKNENSLVIYLY